jgi:Ca2+-binding EF-hand superfamily protein
VGGLIDVATARLATEETIRQVINYLDQFSYISGDINQDGAINIQDLVLAVSVILNTYELSQAQFYAADVNTDGIINIQDIIIILNMIINGG